MFNLLCVTRALNHLWGDLFLDVSCCTCVVLPAKVVNGHLLSRCRLSVLHLHTHILKVYLILCRINQDNFFFYKFSLIFNLIFIWLGHPVHCMCLTLHSYLTEQSFFNNLASDNCFYCSVNESLSKFLNLADKVLNTISCSPNLSIH